MDNKNSTRRLGEILLEKGLLTAEQLDIAIKEQIKRRHRTHPLDSHSRESTSLGEILIELGFINRLQLNRGLNWQLILRKMTLVMSLCAPLMTASVGATAATTSSSKQSSSASSHLVISGTNASSKSSSSSSSKSSSSSSSKPASSVASSASSAASSAKPVPKVNHVAGALAFSWSIPNLRENGDYLDITELAGYEFRYRLATDTVFTYVTVNDPWKNYHNFQWLEGDYVFQVAAYDKNGVYSNFVDVAPR